MPLNPVTQQKLGKVEREMLDILEKGNGSKLNEHNRNLVQSAERHIVGLFSALRQLDSRLEKSVHDALKQYFGPKAKDDEPKVGENLDPIAKEVKGVPKRRNK